MKEVAFEQYLNSLRGRAHGRFSNGGTAASKGLDVGGRAPRMFEATQPSVWGVSVGGDSGGGRRERKDTLGLDCSWP